MKNGSFETVTTIEVLSIDSIQLSHTFREVRSWHFNDHIIMIVEQRETVNQPTEAANDIFEYVRGDRLSHLALLAMGPAAHYDPDNVYIFRYVDEGRRQTRMRVDLDAAVKGVESEDIELESGDWLVVRSRPGYQQQATVRIIGEVEFPGFYVIDDGATTLLDVLDQSGGVTSLASLPKARITRQLEDDEQLDPEFERILTIPPAAWNEDEKQYFNMRSRTKRGQMVVDFVALFEDDPAAQVNNILVRPGDVIIIPGHTAHWFSELETDIEYLIIRTDPDNRFQLR